MTGKHVIKKVLRVFVVLLVSDAGFLGLRAQAPGQQKASGPTLSYEEEIAAWHQQRIAALRRPHSWPSLIALDWLEEGDNLVSGFGVATLSKGTVPFKSLPDVQTELRGKAFASGILVTDADKLEVGSRAFIIIRRGGRCALRRARRGLEIIDFRVH